MGLFKRYNNALKSSPFKTNMISAAFIFTIGDIAAQFVEQNLEQKHELETKEKDKTMRKFVVHQPLSIVIRPAVINPRPTETILPKPAGSVLSYNFFIDYGRLEKMGKMI